MKYNAFIDGSFKNVPGIGMVYGSAYILAPEGSKDWLTGYKACCDEYSTYRNVAGEIFSCMMCCEKALQQPDCTELVIHYDYEGIAKWVSREWKAKTELSGLYVEYIRKYVAPRITLSFYHTKGHSNIEGNDIVDSLAKKSIDDFILKKMSENK